MKAVTILDMGPDSRLEILQAETPAPAPDEVLVRIHATALNRADLMQRRGVYPPPPGASEVPGLEMAGVVEACGDGVNEWAVGDRVMGLLAGGGYAEYTTIHKDLAMPIPDGLSFEEAAAIPEVFLTAYQALFLLGDVEAGENMLVHAGASGVGTAAIQMGREVGANVFVTASPPKHERCLELGAKAAIDYKKSDFAEELESLTQGDGVNLIVDVIGAPYLKKNIKCLAMDGRMVLLAMMGGSTATEFDLLSLFRKRIHIKASTLRSRSLDYKIELTKAFAKRMLPLFVSKKLVPVVDSVYDWQDVKDAHERMAANRNAGKIVLRTL